MARKKISKGVMTFQNFPQSLMVIAIAAVVIGLIIFNIFSGRGQQSTQQPSVIPVPQQTQEGSKFVPPVSLPTTHKVTAGESLAGLSEKYYGNVDFWPGIAKANNLKKPSLIEPNFEIKVPQQVEVKNVIISELRTTGNDKISGTTYTVDYGDTLFEIAQRAYGDGSKWTLIDNTNHLGRLPNGNPLIHAGNVLVIPR